jgi:phosphatidylinositol-3-phosphatase
MKRILAFSLAVTFAAAGCGTSTGSLAPHESDAAAAMAPSPTSEAATAATTSSAAVAEGPSVAPSVAASASPAGPPATAKPQPAPAATQSTATARPAGTTTKARPARGADSYDHIFVVVFENHGYSRIVGRAAAPNFNRLIKQGVLSTAYHGITHPSLPNYLAILGGSTFHITTDCSPATCPVNATNLGSLLSAHGRSWKGYMESMPARCGTKGTASYAVRHDPFVYFNNIRRTSLCRNVVPYPQLATDLRSDATTPRFAFVTPNICNDMHDCSIATGDAWLGRFASRLMSSPAWKTKRSLLIVTFDEDEGAEGNRIATFVVASPVRKSVPAGRRSTVAYNHYNLLRTLEFYLGVPTLGRSDANRAVMTSLIPN